MSIDRRTFIAAGAAAATVPVPLSAQSSAVFHPEDYGARGDGKTNDTKAFAALSAAVNRRGGGTIALRSGRTYVVGSQERGGGRFGWNPSPILALEKLRLPLVILGNGARLRCQPGLRFGTFDPASGARVDRPLPNYKKEEVASPYEAMILVRDCTASVEVRDVELDGNMAALTIGGRFGDKGWQLPATGLLLIGNTGTELIEAVRSHHHALDGAMFIGDPDRSARSRVSQLIARSNGRQGLSITAGRGYDFADCEFSHSGRSEVHSAPGAGVDIEAERHPVRDLTFARCSFLDNAGCGMLSNNGDVSGARFSACRFVGTTSWSAWPRKPGFSFAGCTFVGSVVNAFSSSDPAAATKFTDCIFTDDPKLSPTGQVFTGKGPIANLGQSDNVQFDRCRFDLVAAGVLPWSWQATYRDCIMRQRSPKTAMTKGRFLGTTRIDAPANLQGSKIEGTVILNGKTLPRGAT